MKMLKHKPTGRVYVYNAQLARAGGMEEYDDPDFGKQPEPAPEGPKEPESMQQGPDDGENGDDGDQGGGNQLDHEAFKSLDEMTRDELLAVAEDESKLRGDGAALSRMKKVDLIAYITGQPTGEGA